ncbi:hypothetical protein, partial [Chryseobacterium sp. RR2-3-20]|uniref:hypothetical protein n=1 Tax=Chryseobacterium sp. RR2-3-20 TaxID=2787626 RepID=UPI001ADF9D86
LIGIFWTPIEFFLFHSLTIFNEFFVNLFQEYAFYWVAYNGKGLGEVAGNRSTNVQFCTKF